MTDETPIPEASAPAPEVPVVVASAPGSTVEGGVLPTPQPTPVSDPTVAPEAVQEAPVAPETPVTPVPVVTFVPAAEIVTPATVANRARAIDAEGGVHRPRSDDDVRVGQFANVVSGPEEGRYVVYVRTLSSGDDNYPTAVLVKTRDDRDEFLIVDYSDLRPAASGGR